MTGDPIADAVALAPVQHFLYLSIYFVECGECGFLTGIGLIHILFEVICDFFTGCLSGLIDSDQSIFYFIYFLFSVYHRYFHKTNESKKKGKKKILNWV